MDNSYKSILKGTSIFGGVQVFGMLIAAVRLKFVALILGPAGMGVAGLFNTASLTIQQFAGLGLNLAIVKEVGASREDESRMANLLAAMRPLIVLTALVGALFCMAVPGWLSDITFGDRSYTSGFTLLGVVVFFSVAGSGLMSVLQGLHEVKALSKASIIGSLVGLCVGVPLYWWMGVDGIVPAMAVLAFTTCLWYLLSLRRTLTSRKAVWRSDIHLPILKRILVMGMILMSNDCIRNLCTYVTNVFVREFGGMDDVGFYTSCQTMTAQYSAIVFTAMAMDYLPRLSAVAGDNKEMCGVVNRQMEIVGLLIAPVVCAVIMFAPLVIRILQTDSFLVAVPLLRWLAFSVTLRALMYPLGYIVFAKDNRRLFFWMESVGANMLTLVLTCAGYALFGLVGLGYAAIVDCAICLCVYVGVNRRLYGYFMSREAGKISLVAVAVSGTMMGVCMMSDGWMLYVIGGILLAGVTLISLKKLRNVIRS